MTSDKEGLVIISETKQQIKVLQGLAAYIDTKQLECDITNAVGYRRSVALGNISKALKASCQFMKSGSVIDLGEDLGIELENLQGYPFIEK